MAGTLAACNPCTYGAHMCASPDSALLGPADKASEYGTRLGPVGRNLEVLFSLCRSSIFCSRACNRHLDILTGEKLHRVELVTSALYAAQPPTGNTESS